MQKGATHVALLPIMVKVEKVLIFPPTYVGGGLGTLVEPVKYEPRETACRMAEGVKRSEKAQNVHPLREDRNL